MYDPRKGAVRQAEPTCGGQKFPAWNPQVKDIFQCFPAEKADGIAIQSFGSKRIEIAGFSLAREFCQYAGQIAQPEGSIWQGTGLEVLWKRFSGGREVYGKVYKMFTNATYHIHNNIL